MKYSAVLFDLDGTLMYTLEDIADALNRTLRRHCMAERTLDEVRAFVGNGSAVLVNRAVMPGCGNEKINAVLADYLADYGANCNVKTRPYDGIPELLETLKRAGYKLAVVSNKPDAAVKALSERNFPGTFSIAVGEGPDVRRKPAPDAVLSAMEELRAAKEETVYVGDSEVDVETARNAGVACVSAGWGFRTDRQLLDAGARLIIHSPAELLKVLSGQG